MKKHHDQTPVRAHRHGNALPWLAMRSFPLLLMTFLGVATTFPASALEKSDIPYSQPSIKEHLLDLHVPDGNGPFAAVIMIHGGGFDQGDKAGAGLKPLLNT